MSKAELDGLMRGLLPMGEAILKKYGELYPYGGGLTAKDEIQFVGGEKEGPAATTEDLVELLRTTLRQAVKKGNYKAVALIAGVAVKPPGCDEDTDAVRVSLEDAEGMCIEVFFPYTLSGEGEIEYGKAFAAPADPQIFGPRQPAEEEPPSEQP